MALRRALDAALHDIGNRFGKARYNRAANSQQQNIGGGQRRESRLDSGARTQPRDDE